jgi:hypothetical protein
MTEYRVYHKPQPYGRHGTTFTPAETGVSADGVKIQNGALVFFNTDEMFEPHHAVHTEVVAVIAAGEWDKVVAAKKTPQKSVD